LEVTVNLNNVIGIELRDGHAPFAGYPVNDCSFTILPDGGSLETISITAKNYSTASLATELQNVIQAQIALSACTVAYDANTGKYTITGATDFTIDFSLTTESEMLSYALGFGVSVFTHTSTASVLLSTGAADLQNGKYVQITCPDLRGAYGNTDIIQKIHLAGPANYFVNESHYPRRFLRHIMQIKTLTMFLFTKLATGKTVPFDNRGQAIELEFLAIRLVHRPVVTQLLYT
jgi:hypothetical protein